MGWIALFLSLVPVLCVFFALFDMSNPAGEGKSSLWAADAASNAGTVTGFILVLTLISFPIAYDIVFLVILRKSSDLLLSRGQSRFLLVGFIIMLFSLLMEFFFDLMTVTQTGSFKDLGLIIVGSAFFIIQAIHIYLIITGLRIRRYSRREAREQLVLSVFD